MADEKERKLIREWMTAYHDFRMVMPMAVALDAPDAVERLAEAARADWVAIDAAWHRAEEAKRALDEYRRGRASS